MREPYLSTSSYMSEMIKIGEYTERTGGDGVTIRLTGPPEQTDKHMSTDRDKNRYIHRTQPRPDPVVQKAISFNPGLAKILWTTFRSCY